MTDTKKRSLLVAFIAMVAMAMALMLTACGSSSTDSDEADSVDAVAADAVEDAVEAADEATEPAEMTLEEWLAANPEADQAMQDAFQEGFAGQLDDEIPATASISANGNDLVCKVDLGLTIDEEQIPAVEEAMQGELDSFESTMKEMITELEDETGVSPITITLGYYDEAGTSIFEHTFE